MMPEMVSQKYEQEVKVPPSQVYKSFTNATLLRYWLCDGATAAPRPGGRLIMWWNDGSHASGEYQQLETDHLVSFVLVGNKQTSPTTVTASIQEVEAGSLVQLEEVGPGLGINWAEALENLASVLETGLDLRVVNRPMLGIRISEFNESIASKLGVPINSGILVDDVIDDMGAKAAGLQQNDVIVSLGNKEADNFETLQSALKDVKGGDWVEVGFYRGSEYRTLNMELSKRPIPDIPSDPKQLAEAVRVKFEGALTELEKLLDGVSEEEASFKSEPEEWSIKETVAHLIIGEREFNGWIDDRIGDQIRWSDDWAGNTHARVSAVAAAYPTTAELVELLRRLGVENRAFINMMPSSTVDNKIGYKSIGSFMLESPTHIQEHFEQIQKAIETARK
jgi:uncharacterized protein YndB with AHSA1/START domain